MVPEGIPNYIFLNKCSLIKISFLYIWNKYLPEVNKLNNLDQNRLYKYCCYWNSLHYNYFNKRFLEELNLSNIQHIFVQRIYKFYIMQLRTLCFMWYWNKDGKCHSHLYRSLSHISISKFFLIKHSKLNTLYNFIRLKCIYHNSYPNKECKFHSHLCRILSHIPFSKFVLIKHSQLNI